MTQHRFKRKVTPAHRVDVLVIGGGPAGTWAAIAAAAKGATVHLYDKGFCGTSGAVAPSGNSVWYVDNDAAQREAAKASRYEMGGKLAEHAWMNRVLEQTWVNIQQLKDWGYPFPVDADGKFHGQSLQGPEYMRLMRKTAKAAGVKIFDHSPALELLTDEHGAVCGAAGVHRQKDRHWATQAGAVIIATGGCAFLSNALGCNVLTGDGYLMGAEVGAEFSGMEFSNAYGMCAEFSTVTKSLFYRWATFYDAKGEEIEGAGSAKGRGIVAQRLQTGKVFGCLDKADEQIRQWMRTAQPNFFLPFDRLGIDPFTQHFPITLRLEGTVRGTGGLNIVDDNCATSVTGLYAAGDAATRELICGAFTGGGSHNAAWAMSSGFWAGAAAGEFGIKEKSQAQRTVYGAGTIAFDDGHRVDHTAADTIHRVQQEVFPYEKNWFREGGVLEDSLVKLDTLWHALRDSSAVQSVKDIVRAREAAAMLATSRLMYRSALQRTETRGMARRRDHFSSDPGQRHRLISQGFDDIGIHFQAIKESVPAQHGVAA